MSTFTEMFNIDGIIYGYQKSTNSYIVKNPCSLQRFQNPIEAWSLYIDLVDAHVRRRIGESLSVSGKDRYTGKEINQ